jgi:hypothetical protein
MVRITGQTSRTARITMAAPAQSQGEIIALQSRRRWIA